MKSDMPLIAIGTCQIVAAAPEEGKPAKLPRIEIEAYTGGVMSVGYWGPVAIDLAGLQASDAVPIVFAHDTRTVDSILGQSNKVTNNGKTLAIAGDMMSDSETARNVKTLAANGFKFQASVGVDPLEYSEVETGVTMEVNGRAVEGPFTFVRRGKLNEVSIVPIGADAGTSARIAAEQAKQKGPTMKNEQGQEIPQGPSADQIRAAAVAEESRIAKVREVAKDHPEICAQAVKTGLNPDQVETLVLKAQLAAEKARNERPVPPAINGRGQMDVTPDILAAAVSMRAGLKGAEKAFGADVCNRASDIRIHSFTDLIRAGLARAGKSLDVTRHDTREFIQAAFSTRDIANVLSTVANKFIASGYGTVEQTWRKVAAVRPVVDFKANTGVRLIMSNLLQALGSGGEIQHGALSDDTTTVTADTKALMIGVSRKDIVNDDLGVLSEVPSKLGYAAARTFNTDFWAAFTAAVAANFSASAPKSNQTTGALTIATMGAAEALYLAMTDADGNPIGGELTTLLCGTTAYTPAREIFASTLVTNGSTTKHGAANIYVNRFEPAFSRYLAAAPWYIVSNPMSMPLMVAAFLNGREEPWVETAEADFNTLGIQMRTWFDYGCAFGEWRAAVRSTGV